MMSVSFSLGLCSPQNVIHINLCTLTFRKCNFLPDLRSLFNYKISQKRILMNIRDNFDTIIFNTRKLLY